MKRTGILALTLVFALLLGCTGKPAATRTPEEYTSLYQRALEGAVHEDDLDAVGVLTAADAADAEMTFALLGVTAEDMSAFALSVSLMNVRAYGVALAMPASGREDTVRQGFEGFVENQKQSFERYLEDQYAIASAARVETLEDGTVALVMCEDQDQVWESIKKTLEG